MVWEKDQKNPILSLDIAAKFMERVEANREKYPPHVLQVIEGEVKKLQQLVANSSEFNVTRNYLDWLTLLPWGNYSDEKFDVIGAQKILDEDHYGLTDVKERILEFIAVAKLRGTSQGTKIMCLSGPPGVDKASIARSIARALNRNFFRFSVGGPYDVAEIIKGQRRTCTGAMPGKMVQCLKDVGTANPLVLIDEIDKLGISQAGNIPASSVLELLDPERNANFVDHYLDLPIDLSKVLFVCTANVVDNIPKSLLDRTEIITIAGYITDEKMHIARHYLEKSAQEACRVKPEQVEVTDAALLALIESDCREAGVRNIQKNLEKMYRKIALQLVRQGSSSEGAIEKEKVLVDSSNLYDYVGKPVFRGESIFDIETIVGVVMGLYLTVTGGCISYIETTRIEQRKGNGGLHHVTGKLGDAMKESAQIAHTVARSILREKQPQNPYFANSKLHLHVSAGSTAKNNGPSAGCAMVTSMLSLAINKPVRKHLAMTGKVTLTGKILPIGAVKDKTLAARRMKVKTLILPFGNRRDFDELSASVKQGLDVHFVDHYNEIFKLAFEYDDNNTGN